MKSIHVFLITCLLSFQTYSQVKGVVIGSKDGKKEALFNAKIKLLNANSGTYSDEEGNFELVLPKELPDTMVFLAAGYHPDTIIVDKKDRFISLEVILYSDQMIPEVIASYKKGTTSISRLKVLHVEELGLGELRKAACCNLSESFETNASVDVNITDAVSGAKKIQMMGLDGVYTQIQFENIPYLRGLESSFGLNSIPGTWINSIQITKGTGTVVNGYESMAGLVNIELRKPESMEAFYVNAYANAFGRAELNLHSGIKLNDKWSTGTFAHASGVYVENDHNGDNFVDLPVGSNFAFFNRWNYEGEKMESKFGINIYQDTKTGGQVGFRNDKNLYGVQLDSKHISAFAKTGFFFKKPYNSLGIVYHYKYQTVDALFGNHTFKGIENRGYVNAIYNTIISNSDHGLKIGANIVYSDLNQTMDSLDNSRLEIVPGVFTEYTYTASRLTNVIGVRGDLHNQYGFQWAPRMHSKFILTEHTDLRFTAGKGWRVPNFMIDNISLLATSRQWNAPTETKPEASWNIGGSFVQEFKLFNQKASFILDYYYTWFENQLVVDRDAEYNQIIFKNLQGRSYSNSLQSELAISPIRNLDVRIAYKLLDVQAEYGGKLQQQVMMPKHRGLLNIAYKTRNKRWEFDVTLALFGTARLPVVQLSDSTFSVENTSPIYPRLSSQITYTYKRWEFYLGGENLTNYRQENPIIDAENPFGDYFNATRIWGPVMGMNVYAGLRFSIAQKERPHSQQENNDGLNHE